MWIGINSAGMAFSLINWHSQPDRPSEGTISRGEVVRALLSARSSRSAAAILRKLPVERMNPFRLTTISLGERSLAEWHSDRDALEFISLPWARHHWFSSGFDEAKANQVRRQVCLQIPGRSLDVTALRKLHRSHMPEAGAFSVCMHREDAATVSYTKYVSADTRRRCIISPVRHALIRRGSASCLVSMPQLLKKRRSSCREKKRSKRQLLPPIVLLQRRAFCDSGSR